MSNMVFRIFTSPDCAMCKKEIPRLKRILKNRGYEYTEYSMTDVDGRTEAALLGITKVPTIIGEAIEKR